MNFTNETSKALRLLANAALFAVSLTAGSAFADDPRVMIGTADSSANDKTNIGLDKAITWTAADGGNVIEPWDEGSNTCVYVIQSSANLSANSSFPDVPVELDNSEKVITVTKWTINFPQMTVKSGAMGFRVNDNGTVTLKGGYTVPSGVTFPLYANGAGADADTPRNVTLNATLVGQPDSVVQYSFGLANPPEVNPVPSTLTISGDAASFKGKYVVEDAPTRNKNNTYYVGQAHLSFNCATAFGDPTSELADAVTLGNSAYLSLGANVVQYTTRGITIANGATGGVEVASGDELTLTAPVTTGTGAAFQKIGGGTATLDGDCTSAAAMEVAEGTLVLGVNGQFANGLAVTVKSGAKLVQNKYVGNIDVTCEEGGTYDIQYVVPYSAATGVSTPLDFTAAVPSLPLSIRLTEPVEIASFADNGYTAKRIKVATLPSDTTATAADFNDATEKYCGLPKTSFEIVTGDGCKELVLVARPVVWSVKDFYNSPDNNITLNGLEGYWSYGETAQPGYDYLLTNWLSRTGANNARTSDAFNGDSLTVQGITFTLTTPGVDVGNLECHDTVTIFYNNGSAKGYTGITSGTVEIADGAMVNLQTRQASNGTVMTNCIAVPVSGSGTLVPQSYSAIEGGMPVYLTGDNSGYSGKMVVTCKENKDISASETTGTTLHLGQGTSFGGAMDAATADGVVLEKYSFLMPEQTMTLDAANRGITVTAGGFDVPEGVALTVAVPLTVDGAAIKRGSGELALSGAATFGSGATFAVKEGAVRALSDAAVAGDFSFADGTTIVLDPGAGLVNGFCGSFAVTGEGTPKVTVAVDTTSAAFSADGAATLPICTVPATAADLTGSFTLAKVRGCSAELVKENVTVDGVACVRYYEHFSKAGTVLYVR